MEGIRSDVTRSEIAEFSRLEGMGFRLAPAGIVEGPVDEGLLNIPRDYARARQCTTHPLKFTLTGPHMLCKKLMDHHYKSRPELAVAIGQALAKQIELRHVSVRSRMPFRHGIATLSTAPDLLVVARFDVDGRPSQGISADMLPPKWFGKQPDASPEDEIDEMVMVIRRACHWAVGVGQQPS